MTPVKRLFDVALALLGVAIFAIPGLMIAGILLASQGQPILYRSERMQSPEKAFWLWKFRTMHHSLQDAGVSGADKAARITRPGHLLRRTRLDELPQLWNVLGGDISFVGPRPPLRTYVERFPHLYARVLQSRPGITGLATLTFHAHEESILSDCFTAAETDAAYMRRCVPRKARLDLIYQKNQCLLLDVVLLMRTIFRLFRKQHSA